MTAGVLGPWEYFPVASTQYAPKRLRKYKDTPVFWADPRFDNARDSVPSGVMLSFAYWGEIEFERDSWYWTKHSRVFGDSGGHSVMSKGLSLDPLDVIRWQIGSTDLGALMDIPPFPDDSRGHDVDWDHALAVTKQNVKRALTIYEKRKTDFKWWGVIQGRTWKEMAAWYDGIRDAYPYKQPGESWAFNAIGGSLDTVARSLGFCHNNDLHTVHSLGTGGGPQVAVLFAFAQMARFTRITVDASSSIQQARSASVLERFEPGESIQWTAARRDVMRKLMAKCKCQACVLGREEQDRYGQDLSYETMRRDLHNIIALNRGYARTWETIKSVGPERFLRDTFPKEYGPMMRAFTTGGVSTSYNPPPGAGVKGGLLGFIE